jgi:hypothetical protein
MLERNTVDRKVKVDNHCGIRDYLSGKSTSVRGNLYTHFNIGFQESFA